MLNIRSVNNKTDDVRDIIDTHHLDVIVLTKSWHEDADCVPIKRLRKLGLNVVEVARVILVGTKKENVRYVNHGSIAVASRLGVVITRVVVALKICTFEHLCVRIILNGAYILATIYRSGLEPPSDAFLKELSVYLEFLSTFNEFVILTEDINIRLDCDDYRQR